MYALIDFDSLALVSLIFDKDFNWNEKKKKKKEEKEEWGINLNIVWSLFLVMVEVNIQDKKK